MLPEEIARVVRIAAKLGIHDVKLTGGEPLLREDVVDVVRSMASIPSVEKLSMTTNAAGLLQLAGELKEAGLQRVNVNLPTLKPELYRYLTGGALAEAIEGIEAALQVGLTPIKINMLILKGLNDGEIDDMIDFCKDKGLILQVIELEPVNAPADFYRRHHMPLDAFRSRFMKEALSTERRRSMQNRIIFHLPRVDVELVPPVENTEFCLHCTRMRLTSDGKLKPCLMRNDNLVDILTPMRKGADDRALEELFLKAVSLREPFYKGQKRD